MLTRIFIITLLIMAFAGSQLRVEADVTPEEFYNVTSKMTYDNLNMTSFKESADNENNSFIVRSVGKLGDLITYVGVEGSRAAMEFGYENPEYNFEWAWKLMFITLFAFLIIPAIKIGLFLGYGIYSLFQWIKKKFKKQ